jgi:hypothetical protein
LGCDARFREESSVLLGEATPELSQREFLADSIGDMQDAKADDCIGIIFALSLTTVKGPENAAFRWDFMKLSSCDCDMMFVELIEYKCVATYR